MAFPVYTNEVENPTHFAKDATQPVYFSENNMPIGLIPFVPFIYKIFPHVKKDFVDDLLVRVKHSLETIGNDVELVSLDDLEHRKKGLNDKWDTLEYIGKPRYSSLVKVDLLTTPSLLHNYLHVTIWAGENYKTILAFRSSYSYGRNAHLDVISELMLDAVKEVNANAQNINFDLGQK
jgi:hypothetical protein